MLFLFSSAYIFLAFSGSISDDVSTKRFCMSIYWYTRACTAYLDVCIFYDITINFSKRTALLQIPSFCCARIVRILACFCYCCIDGHHTFFAFIEWFPRPVVVQFGRGATHPFQLRFFFCTSKRSA